MNPLIEQLAMDPVWRKAFLRDGGAEEMRRSFRLFAERAWSIVEPATPFIPNWHVDAVCEHLEAVAHGKIRRLVITIPPGHAKSLLTAVLWPAWIWTWRPQWRGLFASYAAGLAIRDSVRCRTLVDSPWYQETFVVDPWDETRRWRLKDDQNAKDYYETTKSGFRLSLGVGGKGTGYRGDAVIVDDALNAMDAQSKATRESTIAWWDQTMSSRVNNLAKDSFVVMGQRLHEEDLAGHCIEKGTYEHLCLPSDFDPDRRCVTSLGTVDKRTEQGEPLFPALFPREVLDDARKTLGSDGYASQHDQLPLPTGGGMFKKVFWNFWRWDEQEPSSLHRPKGCTDRPTRVIAKRAWRWDNVVASIDCTFKSAEQSKSGQPDFVVLTCWGAKGADRFLLYRWRRQAGFKETCDAIREFRTLYPRCYRILIEDKANGSAVIETLTSEISGIIPVEPEGGKESRANAIAPQVEAGNVYLPEGAAWLDEFVGELAGFPKGKHDDQVDSMSQALLDMHTIQFNATRAIAQGRAVG